MVGPPGHPLTQPDASSELRRAARQLDKGDLAGAEATLRSLLGGGPNRDAQAAQAVEIALAVYEQGDLEGAAPLLRAVVETHPGTRAASFAEGLLDEIAVVGRSVPSLSDTTWLQGATSWDMTPVTVVVFWETWCPHCRREVPKLQDLVAKHPGGELQVVGLSRLTRGSTAVDVMDFAQAEGIAFALGVEDGALSDRLGVEGVPAAAVVVGGQVVWRGHPMFVNDALLGRYLPGLAD